MIVVDTSALAAIVLKEPGWRDLVKYVGNAISVDHVVKEVCNAIWKASYLRKYLSFKEALKAYEVLELLIGKNILLHSERDYLDKALELALSHGITVYDAIYIALAIEKKAKLLTLDEKQRSVAKGLGVEVIP